MLFFLGLSKSKNSKQRKRENQVTRTLLVVTSSFLVLLALQCVSKCFWMTVYKRKEMNENSWMKIDSLYGFAKIGMVINSSINCLLYCVTGSMFKKELAKLFGCGLVSRFRASFSNLSTSKNILINGSLQ